jgi:hypothetical protein
MIRTALTPGAFDDAMLTASVQHARHLFLRTIERIHPEVLKDLESVDADGGVKAWAVRWRLDADWVLGFAERTRARWNIVPRHSGKRWNLDQASMLSEPDDTAHEPSWPLPRPDAQTETEVEYLARVRAVAQECWRGHVEALLSSGLRPGRPKNALHVNWAVRFQVGEEDYSTIAQSSSRRRATTRANLRNTVRSAVIPFLAMIGLEPRPVRVGRRAGAID